MIAETMSCAAPRRAWKRTLRRCTSAAGATLAFAAAAATVYAAIGANATITWTLPPNPTSVTITAGQSVTWQGDFAFHPLIDTDASFSVVGSSEPATAPSYTKTFPDPGTYYFMCGVHLSLMPTTVTVTPPCPAGPYATFDIDGDGKVEAMTDGLLLIRYALGVRGDALLANALGGCASRATSEAIETYISTHIVP